VVSDQLCDIPPPFPFLSTRSMPNIIVQSHNLTVQALSGAVRRVWRVATATLTATWYFLRRLCSTAERPLHFIKITLPVNKGAP